MKKFRREDLFCVQSAVLLLIFCCVALFSVLMNIEQ